MAKQKQIVIFVPGGGGVERLAVAYELHGQNAMYFLSGTKGEIDEFLEWCEDNNLKAVGLEKIFSNSPQSGVVCYLQNIYAFDTTSNIEDWNKMCNIFHLFHLNPFGDEEYDFFISTASGHFMRFNTCWQWCKKNLGIPMLELKHIKAGKDTSLEWILGLAYRWIPGFIAWARENRKQYWQKKGQLY